MSATRFSRGAIEKRLGVFEDAKFLVAIYRNKFLSPIIIVVIAIVGIARRAAARIIVAMLANDLGPGL